MPARMIPTEPKEFHPTSKEGIVFQALKEGLTEDYYVFHSFNAFAPTADKTVFERELDFVVVHKDKGILYIEVKAGKSYEYDNGKWYCYDIALQKMKEMKHKGPYNQASSGKRVIRDKIEYHSVSNVRALMNKCRFLHCVMFVDVDFVQFSTYINNGLPPETHEGITILAEDVTNIRKRIDEIFEYRLPTEHYDPIQPMSETDFAMLIDKVMNPHFRITPSARANNILLAEGQKQLMREQYLLLDFLEEQQCAVINGAAGTGKTMLAVEKARRHSESGDKVLFLCYNRMLCDDLNKRHKRTLDAEYNKRFENVEFKTINKLTHDITGSFEDYKGLIDWLTRCIDKTVDLGYQHIIVDEGQDFGLLDEEIKEDFECSKNSDDNKSIIDYLKLAAEENNGTFYLFYDKYQTIQGGKDISYDLPECITDCDCRLTLKKNCRNTSDIAKTSVTPLRDSKNKAIRVTTAISWELPYKPVLHVMNDSTQIEKILNSVIDDCEKKGFSNIVILSHKTIERSLINSLVVNNRGKVQYKYNGNSYLVSTCRMFKGLEASAIILIDLDKYSFAGKEGNLFYVGSSRAKLRLDMICNLAESDYSSVLYQLEPGIPPVKNPKKILNYLESAFGSQIMVNE